VAAQAPVAPAAPPPPAGPASLPQFLSPHEQETLARIGDQLVPGSGSVGVAAIADRLLSVESAKGQRRFRNALGAFEHEARVRHAKTWIELSPAEQAAILDEAAKTPSARSEPPVWTRGQPVRNPEPKEPPPSSLRDHLVDLRDFVARIYFSSEPGMRELGWEGNLFWESLPGCDARG
jgi:hypothetical protein